MNSYQEGLEQAAAEHAIVEDYIDDHETLADVDAFQGSDRASDTLIEVWRIVQTYHVTQAEEAVADIRSTIMERVIRPCAEAFARQQMDI